MSNWTPVLAKGLATSTRFCRSNRRSTVWVSDEYVPAKSRCSVSRVDTSASASCSSARAFVTSGLACRISDASEEPPSPLFRGLTSSSRRRSRKYSSICAAAVYLFLISCKICERILRWMSSSTFFVTRACSFCEVSYWASAQKRVSRIKAMRLEAKVTTARPVSEVLLRERTSLIASLYVTNSASYRRTAAAVPPFPPRTVVLAAWASPAVAAR
mmetsp:Transcript_8221/g.25399  ORF Transcript_8221/g.25399 Transcript_8221/m.25399 type:complete len:215 (+) Transcript_8221:1398-2042(+)